MTRSNRQDPNAPLAITTGDPGGVGPEVSLRAVAAHGLGDRCVLFGDGRALRGLARRLGLDDRGWPDLRPGDVAADAAVSICDVGQSWTVEATRHEPTAAGGAAALAALDAALAAALAGSVRGIVTGPMSKAAVQLAGRDFIGHTEHLAAGAGLTDDAVTMMFLGPRLRVALATTHLSIAELPAAITPARVLRAIVHLGQAVLSLRDDGGPPTRIVVTGLNPHAGERGLFGNDETRAIEPALAEARLKPPFDSPSLILEGPIGAETAFREAASGRVGGVVAMMHDQATIASKLLDWTQAVNVTWGLPFVRTSVDHGVAYDAARNGTADPQGMGAALNMARLLTGSPRR